MSSHVRKQIRDKVAQVLATANAAAVIAESRVYPLPPDMTSAVLVYSNSDVVVDSTLTAPRKLQRELTIVCECVVRAVTNLDDEMDAVCLKVENALGADNTLAGIVKDCILADTQITHDFSGDAPIGNARIQFRVTYRTAEGNAAVSV
jgi:hypothetical protein